MGQLLLDGVPIGVPDRSVTAGGVSYDNAQSGLSATNVQGAVDEVATYESETVQSGVLVERYGKIRHVSIDGTFTYSNNSFGITLSAKDRPSSNKTAIGLVYVNSLSKYYALYFALTNAGTFRGFGLGDSESSGYKSLSGSVEVTADITYIVNN